MVKNKNNKRKTNKRKHENHYGALAILFFVALVGTCGFFAWKQYNSRSQEDGTPAVADARNINTAPTNHEVEEKEESKTEDYADVKDLAEKAAEEVEVEKNADGLKVAEVFISNAGQDTMNNVIFASGIITNVVNHSGDCTYTFSNGGETITESSSALPSAKETICGVVEIDSSRFTPGEWTVTLNYKSDFAEGVSDATTFTIQ